MVKRLFRPERDIHAALSATNQILIWRARTIIFVLIAFILFPLQSVSEEQSKEICRVGFTYKAFGELNENDAMAAVRAWTLSFIKERNIPATPQTIIFRDILEIKTALKNGTVEMINMTSAEFAQVAERWPEII